MYIQMYGVISKCYIPKWDSKSYGMGMIRKSGKLLRRQNIGIGEVWILRVDMKMVQASNTIF